MKRQDTIGIEICIDASDPARTRDAVLAAYNGGASRVELCSHMHLDGLTPPRESIERAREAFGARRGLLVMIRPRGGDFSYSATELEQMATQIRDAKRAGADGVVLGALRADIQNANNQNANNKNATNQNATNHRVDLQATGQLVQVARQCELEVTFHRAVDATPDVVRSMHEVQSLGVQRLLTAGVRWGQAGGAVEGVASLRRLLIQANNIQASDSQASDSQAGDMEIVVAGGISPHNLSQLLSALPRRPGAMSFHAFSGVQVNGKTSVEAVRLLVQVANESADRIG